MYLKLRGRIVEKYGTIGAFADDIGLSKNSVSMKLNKKKGFSQSDILLWCEKLGIPKSDIGDYFFCTDSSNKLNGGL